MEHCCKYLKATANHVSFFLFSFARRVYVWHIATIVKSIVFIGFPVITINKIIIKV